MKIRFLLLVMCFSVVSSGCRGDNVGVDKPQIIIVLKTLSSEYWRFVEAGARQACSDLGAVGKVVGPSSEGHVVDQVSLLEDILNKKPDALIIAPILPSTIVSVLTRLQGNPMPILFLDTDARWSKKAAYVGTSNVVVGRTGGQALGALLKRGDQVALINGALGNPATDGRINGARKALQEAGMRVIAEQSADSDQAKAMGIMENILQTYPDIKGVFAANDDMALGALRAVRARGIGKDIKVIGTDGTCAAIQSILRGELAGTVAQNPYMMGYRAVENACKKIRGGRIDKCINSGVGMIVKKNAEERLAFLQRAVPSVK